LSPCALSICKGTQKCEPAKKNCKRRQAGQSGIITVIALPFTQETTEGGAHSPEPNT